ncbi:MAG TPA: hypothetical protein VGJ90_10240 [Methylophilaceae bacterium]|jgi:hypothetical protein
MKIKFVKYTVMLVLTMVAVLGYAEVDSDFMTTMDDLNKSLTSNIAVNDAKAAEADAVEMKKMFDEVEAFFVKKPDAADGVKWAQESRDLSALIAKAVVSKDFDTASQAAVTLSKTCKACHKIYKKKD